MAIQLNLGPAGSGKTHRCLAEIRDSLQAAPDGPPLLLIAPRQSTYLLERQLLGMGVKGFTRLEILSFDRLARRVLEGSGQPIRDLLSEEGRVMVLRALLLQNGERLQAFRDAARTAGFAAKLSEVLRELQRGGTSAEHLRNFKLPAGSPALLSEKLHDLALLLEAYRDWLQKHRLHDPDELLVRAAKELAAARKTSKPAPQFAALWLDGFAEMTPPEINLLAELLPNCNSATLAFCLDREPCSGVGGNLNPLWRVTTDTVQSLQSRIREMGLPFTSTRLPSDASPLPRFQHAQALQNLAIAWNAGGEFTASEALEGINLVECADPEAEALLAVRLINDHVRNRNGRYRDVSVMVRRMEDYADVLQRAFRRHGIPFFADHREPMGHHPLAELTRSALSLVAHGWAHEDWIGALRTGLVVDNAQLVDAVENAALAHGIRGPEWLDLSAYQKKIGLTEGAIQELIGAVEGFQNLKDAFSATLSGPELAKALRNLWAALNVPETLERWQAETDGMNIPPIYRTIHRTAWEQMEGWCSNLALAFAGTQLPARDWLSVAEAGLSGMTLGVVPPALDQVFIGAVDRARQPEVKLTIVVGLNSGVFPAAPAAPALLNRAERIVLQSEEDMGLIWEPVRLASRENYYAYIACTRPGERLCVSWSRRGRDGKALIRSAVAERLLAFAGLNPNAGAADGDIRCFDGRLKSFNGTLNPETVESVSELLECPGWEKLLPEGETSRRIGVGGRDCRRLQEELLPDGGEENRLLGKVALEKLHPAKALYSSVSALETFAQCPFHHFAGKELRLNERDEFKADQKSAGTLLHAVINQFHGFTLKEKKQWRNWEPEAAAEKIRELGAELMCEDQFAPQSQDELVRWETGRTIGNLALAVRQMVEWFKNCAFDPVLSEFKFRDRPDADGSPPDAPAWGITLENGRTLKLQGSIDRLDICRLEDGRVLVAVFDYKTGGKSPNRALLQKGFELQLLGYLAFAMESPELKKTLAAEASPLVPAGAFYVPLSPRIKSSGVKKTDDERATGYLQSLTHLGRADRQWIEAAFDKSAGPAVSSETPSLQFKTSKRSADFLNADDFAELLKSTRTFLAQHANEILAGKVGVLPARFSAQSVSCDFCPFQPVCRFEPVFGNFRPVKYDKPAASAEKDSDAAADKKAPGRRKAGKKSS